MNIGFDLDKIFINNPPFIPSTIIEKLYRKKANGILLYRMPSRPEQLLRLFTHYPLFRPLIKKNIEFVKLLSAQNSHKYYLISSRFKFLQKRTEKLTKKLNFEKVFHGIHFNFTNKQPHLFKNEVIKNLKIDRYVDDDLPLLKFLAKENPKIRFFWFNNKKKEELGKNLHAITHLSEILK